MNPSSDLPGDFVHTAHYFFDDLQKETKIPILHMPKEAVKQIHREQITGKVAFLGTEGSVKAGVYENELKEQGINYLIPGQDLQAKINHLIYQDVKENDYINKFVKRLNCQDKYTKEKIDEIAKMSIEYINRKLK